MWWLLHVHLLKMKSEVTAFAVRGDNCIVHALNAAKVLINLKKTPNAA